MEWSDYQKRIFAFVETMPGNAVVTIFRQSRLYGGEYRGDSLPHRQWQWPKETWLQTRLKQLRAET